MDLRLLYHLGALLVPLALMPVLGAPASAWWTAVIPYAAGIAVEIARDLEIDRALERHPAGRQR